MEPQDEMSAFVRTMSMSYIRDINLSHSDAVTSPRRSIYSVHNMHRLIRL